MTFKPLYLPENSENNYDSKNVNEFVYNDLELLDDFEKDLKRKGGQE